MMSIIDVMLNVRCIQLTIAQVNNLPVCNCKTLITLAIYKLFIYLLF